MVLEERVAVGGCDAADVDGSVGPVVEVDVDLGHAWLCLGVPEGVECRFTAWCLLDRRAISFTE